MTTYTALSTVMGKEAAETLAEGLEGLEPVPMGVGVFEVEDGSGLWEVGAYFEDAKPDAVDLALLAAAYGAKSFAVSELPETDWVAEVRRELHPVVAGRFFVYGSHDADKLPPKATGLLIEAAMAFGTGHHRTTQGCLEALDTLINEGFVATNTADIGCGTAVLALAAAKTFPGAVIASDIDLVAVDVARVNAAANGVADRVACVEAAGFAHRDLAARAPYDLIFANILKGPLIELAPDVVRCCATSGRVILSGLLTSQVDAIVAAYAEQGLPLIRRADLGEWSTLTLGH